MTHSVAELNHYLDTGSRTIVALTCSSPNAALRLRYALCRARAKRPRPVRIELRDCVVTLRPNVDQIIRAELLSDAGISS